MTGSKKGFSLLEVLIGMAIFMFGMLGVAALLISSIKGNSFAGSLTEANVLAANQLETLLTLDYNNADLIDANGDGDGGLALSAAALAASADHQMVQGKYTVYWCVSDNSLYNDTKSVRVWVCWTVKNAARSINLLGVIPKT